MKENNEQLRSAEEDKAARKFASEILGVNPKDIMPDDTIITGFKAGVKWHASQFKSHSPSDHENDLARNLAELQVMYGEKCAELNRIKSQLPIEQKPDFDPASLIKYYQSKIREIEGDDAEAESQPLLIEGVEREWISVTERLPERVPNKNYSQVKCLVNKRYEWKRGDNSGVFYQIQILTFNHEHECWDGEDGDDHDCDIDQVTHWMPLPSPPKNG